MTKIIHRGGIERLQDSLSYLMLVAILVASVFNSGAFVKVLLVGHPMHLITEALLVPFFMKTAFEARYQLPEVQKESFISAFLSFAVPILSGVFFVSKYFPFGMMQEQSLGLLRT